MIRGIRRPLTEGERRRVEKNFFCGIEESVHPDGTEADFLSALRQKEEPENPFGREAGERGRADRKKRGAVRLGSKLKPAHADAVLLRRERRKPGDDGLGFAA